MDMRQKLKRQINDKSVAINNTLNISSTKMRNVLERLIARHRYLLIHKYDVERLLCVDFLRKLRFEKVYVVNTELTFTELCEKQLGHVDLTCTRCRCYNVWRFQRYSEQMYIDGDRETFYAFAYRHRLISKFVYEKCDRAERNVRSKSVRRFSNEENENRRPFSRSKSMAPFLSSAASERRRRDESSDDDENQRRRRQNWRAEPATSSSRRRYPPRRRSPLSPPRSRQGQERNYRSKSLVPSRITRIT